MLPLTCPRISPPGFLPVCTFTYVLPLWSDFEIEALMCAVPLAGDLQGPQRATITGPALPFAPAWTCAAVAGPVRWSKVSFQVIFVPVTVAVKLPLALIEAPDSLGTSCRVSRFALKL